MGVKDRPKADRWGPQVLDIDTAWRMLWEAGKGLCCPPGVWGVGGSSAGNPVFDGPVGVSVIPSPLLVSGMELVRQRGRRVNQQARPRRSWGVMTSTTRADRGDRWWLTPRSGA